MSWQLSGVVLLVIVVMPYALFRATVAGQLEEGYRRITSMAIAAGQLPTAERFLLEMARLNRIAVDLDARGRWVRLWPLRGFRYRPPPPPSRCALCDATQVYLVRRERLVVCTNCGNGATDELDRRIAAASRATLAR